MAIPDRKFEYFGFELKRSEKIEKDKQNRESFTKPEYNDGAITIESGGSGLAAGMFLGQYMDLDANYRSERQFIQKYREIAKIPEVDSAIDAVVNEAVVTGTNDPSVTINLDNVELEDKIKDMITEEFERVMNLLSFNTRGYEIFRKWYVDSKLYYHKIIDEKNPKKGIKEVRPIDALQMRKIREIQKERSASGAEIIKGIDEYYLFLGEDAKSLNTAVKIAKDSVTFVPSGLFDIEKKIVLGYLYKAIKPSNQLRMMEDAVVIYRLSRAPERRVFYIDVGTMPKNKAEQYIKEIARNHRNKMVYDGSSGELRDDKRHMSMMEDYWMPRREGGQGTQIDTLPGGQNLGDIEDVIYFQKKLYKSLNVPVSRLESETGFSLGRSSEITRDELMFSRFVDRLRTKFSELFFDLLKTQLALKGIMDVHEFEKYRPDIFFDFQRDSHFTELKNAELLQERMNLLRDVDNYRGKYFSTEYVQKNVLQMTEEEIEEELKKIEEEKKKGIIPEDDTGGRF